MLLQFRIIIHTQSKRMRTPERRTVFHNFSPDFPSIFHLKLFSLLYNFQRKKKNIFSSKNILHSSETFYIISNHCKKRMVKLKCSIYFPYIFSKFSYNFLQLFQMTKLNCFHHHRSTDVCKNTGIGKTFYSKECFLCNNSSTGCTTSASTAPVPVVATSHMTSRVCVCACVRMNFSAIYRLVPCLKA